MTTTEQREAAKQLAREAASKWGGDWRAYVLPDGEPAVRSMQAPSPVAAGTVFVGHWSSPSANVLKWHPADLELPIESRMQFFMKRLEAAGGDHGMIQWAAKTDPGQQFDNVACYPIYGKYGEYSLGHKFAGHVVLVETEGGLDVFLSSESTDYDSDVKEILRRGSRTPKTDPQTHVNGYRIVAQVSTPKGFATRPGRFILVEKADVDGGGWVTAWQGRDDDTSPWDSGWTSGNYFNSYDLAFDDFIDRAKRG